MTDLTLTRQDELDDDEVRWSWTCEAPGCEEIVDDDDLDPDPNAPMLCETHFGCVCSADGCDKVVLDEAEDGSRFCDGHRPEQTTAEPTRKRQTDGSVESSRVVIALEAAYEDIRQRHPDAPPVVIALAGSRRKQGHFAPNRWERDEAGVAELFVAGEGLRLGAEHVLGVLLHEVAHGIGAVRKIQDCSRDGRYHNRRYKALAEEVGLHVEWAPSRGWSDTSLTAEAIDAYVATLTNLDTALRMWRRKEPDAGPKARNLAVAVCRCERRIRIAPATYQQGPIICGCCGQPFSVSAPMASAA